MSNENLIEVVQLALANLRRVQSALTVKRQELVALDSQLEAAQSQLRSAEAAAAVDPSSSPRGARQNLTDVRERIEYATAAIAGLESQEAELIKELKSRESGLRIQINLRADNRLVELEREMEPGLRIIRQVLSRARGVSIGLHDDHGYRMFNKAFIQGATSSENLVGPNTLDSTITDQEAAAHTEAFELLRSLQRAIV